MVKTQSRDCSGRPPSPVPHPQEDDDYVNADEQGKSILVVCSARARELALNECFFLLFLVSEFQNISKHLSFIIDENGHFTYEFLLERLKYCVLTKRTLQNIQLMLGGLIDDVSGVLCFFEGEKERERERE